MTYRYYTGTFSGWFLTYTLFFHLLYWYWSLLFCFCKLSYAIDCFLCNTALPQGRHQHKMSEGTKRKKLKTMVIISVVRGVRNAA